MNEKEKLETQRKYVKNVLLSTGSISRNHCLARNITRLSAIIHWLRGELDTEIVGARHYKTKDTYDYVYKLNNKQNKQ